MTEPEPLRLLILTDIHHGRGADRAPAWLEAPGETFGTALVGLAVEEAARRGGFHAVVILGDLIEDGRLDDAELLLRQVRDALDARAPGVPRLVVPGNHDVDAARVFRVFGARPGLHEIGGHRFVVFADAYGEGDVCTRPPEALEALRALAATPGGPIIACQHNPMNPFIDDPYPYMLTNRGEVIAGYADLGVLLSISGHLHAGQTLNEHRGVWYFTAPALCESPHPYTLLRLRGRRIAVDTCPLEPPGWAG